MREKSVASFIHVNSVGRKNALGSIVLIVLLEFLHEGLPEVEQLAAGFSGDLSADSGITIELSVGRIEAIRFFPMTVGVQRMTRDPASLILAILSLRPFSNSAGVVPFLPWERISGCVQC